MEHRGRGWWATVVAVVLVLAGACASDGDADGSREEAEGTTSGPTAPPETEPSLPVDDLTIVDLNMLHGLTFDEDCPAETASCQAAARIDILWEEIAGAGCPDVITLQEVGPAQLALLPERIGELCTGDHTIATEPIGLPVEVAVLTSLPVLEHEGFRLSGINWAAQRVRVASAIGPVDVVTATSRPAPIRCRARATTAPTCARRVGTRATATPSRCSITWTAGANPGCSRS